MTSLVTSRDEGRVRILTLDRPEARNALDAAIRLDLIANLHEAENDDAIGAVVLMGAGSAFAAGADLKELLARTPLEQRTFLEPPHIYSVIEGLRKPVIAAINGHALGAGLELATACDVRVCSAEARLGQPEVTLALIPGGGGTQRLVRLVGRGAAARLVLTGDALTADEALRIGLVDFVVPRERVMAKAVEVAAAMARHDPHAVAAAKRALQAATEIPYKDGLVKEIEEFVRLHERDGTKARIKAFLEKR
ncbi:MAG: enoyl-CoA hydratase/isomerase family protein [Thermoplasmatota archaeon]|nr:enoyl-CoA hydratase/isomerase family protein [Halobacteriales archaeon]